MDNFRALCSALVDAIDSEIPFWEEELTSIADHARAALAESVPPAEGEVAELVAWLRQRWPHLAHIPNSDYAMGVRAAELLERQAAPVPMPVCERLPGPEDCDAEGRCWWFAAETEVDFGAWTFGTSEACTGDNWGHTHWLPATVLPLPTSEAQP